MKFMADTYDYICSLVGQCQNGAYILVIKYKKGIVSTSSNVYETSK